MAKIRGISARSDAAAQNLQFTRNGRMWAMAVDAWEVGGIVNYGSPKGSAPEKLRSPEPAAGATEKA